MNAICGLVDWRGDRAGLEPFAKLLAALRHRGPDGAASWCGERVALGCQAHHTTPDAPLDRQPLHLADPDLAVAADVRLDNREDLIRRLGISGAQPPGPSDAGLILLAYQRWGEDFPRHLVGAFALALWDGRKRRLLLVRDPLGQRALFYAARGGSISFASEAKAILAAGQEPSPNLRTIARMAYPEARRRDNTATFFAGIKALPAATSMVLDADGARQTQYWTPDAGATLHFKRDEDLLEALLALLEDVVAAHTRALHPVAVLLSGGLDSSAITAIAARRLALDGASLTTLSSVLPPQVATGDHRLRDERDYIELFGSWPNIEQRFIAPVGGPLDDVDRRVQSREAPLLDTRDYLYAAFADAAADVGARVLLDGCGGELGLTYKGDGVFLEWLLRGDLVRLSRELRLASRQTGAALWPLIRSQLLRPLLPHPIRAGLRRRAFLPSAGIHALTPAFLAEQLGPEHTELGHLQERASRAYRSHRVVQSRLMDPARRLAGVQSHAGYARVERRFPLLDRRLLEFCLAAPAQLKIRDGYPRYLARGALAGVLPEQIRWRTSKEPLSPDYALRCNAQRGQAAAYLSEIGPRDPVRAVVDVQRLQRWATHEMTASRYSTPENLRAGFGVYQGIYLIAFLRQFPQFSA